MNTATTVHQDLEQAKARMKEAAQHAMRNPPPRDMNRARECVAMQLDEANVTQYYAERQSAFDSGLVPQ